MAPDGRSAYLLRSSGAVVADSLENPDVVERLDLGTGSSVVVAHADEIIDASVSADGRRLALVRWAGESVITLVDLDGSAVRTVRAPRQVPSDRFQGVNAVAISPDAGTIAYVLAVEAQAQVPVDTLRIRHLGTADDVLAYRAHDGESITDVDWAPDGSSVLAVVTHRDRHASVETPARYRVLRIDPRSLDVSIGDGFGPGITPLSSDGRQLAGIVPRPNESETRRFDLVTSTGATSVLALPESGVARDLSLARCSYE
jgi:dipeptidyl aminopeptidase/acylaminoacyl peptidase